MKNYVCPCGYIYEPENDAAFFNHTQVNNHIQYVEDIYIGYKWFETGYAKIVKKTNTGKLYQAKR